MERMVGYEWHLADLVHRHRLSATSDLRRLLAERGVELSGTHVYRLVTQPPERISLTVLSALCDIFDCELSDLITVTAEAAPRRRAAGNDVALLHDPDRPARARIWQPDDE
jgi:DNA-binding Xre family transcriptional regulator